MNGGPEGNSTLLDVPEPQEYAAGHVAGAGAADVRSCPKERPIAA
jgi:hypothetical protein